MMLSILLFIKYRQKTIFIFPLFLSTILLIMSHHLTTYFYLMILVFIVFFENISQKKWTNTLRRDIVYILTSSVLIFSNWAFIAIPVYEGFMNYKINIGPISFGNNAVIFFFYTLFVISFLIIILDRKFGITQKRIKKHHLSSEFKFLISFGVGLIILLFFAIVDLPTLNFTLPLETAIFIIPYILILSLAIVGISFTKKLKNGAFIQGWFFAVIFSLIFSIVTSTRQLFPQRHPEYFEAPLAILVIFGINALVTTNNIDYLKQKVKKIFKIKKPIFEKNNKSFSSKKCYIFFCNNCNCFC